MINPNDPLLEVYLFESQQLLERLEEILLEGEKAGMLSDDDINEIFRIMHTIKGSSAMMSFDNLAHVSHTVEDLFSQIREKKVRNADWGAIFDIVLGANDFIKNEMSKIQSGQEPDGENAFLQEQIDTYLGKVAHRKTPPKAEEDEVKDASSAEEDDDLELPGCYYGITVSFEKDCKMENIRAFGIVNTIQNLCDKLAHIPEDLFADESSDEIAANSFYLFIHSDRDPADLEKIVSSTLFLKDYAFSPLADDAEEIPVSIRKKDLKPAQTVEKAKVAKPQDTFTKQNFISVNVTKLDKLMNLVGEIVSTESMVIKNPDIVDMQLENFEKAAQQLRKLTDELQDTVMAIRMVPVSSTFHKMLRIVRDMSKKVAKDVELVIIGEETEVDKSINDSLSDPLMHLIRNAIDHGLETPAEREAKGKPKQGKVTLEARNTGGEVMIIVSDDGRGLNRQKLIEKAISHGVVNKPEAEISDKEAYSYMFLPGLSTKETTTEFSGRGVGMDVVRKNIETIGGAVSVESTLDEGTSIIIRIPLTLAIINGMSLSVGGNNFIMPVLSIKEAFKPQPGDIFTDPDGQEMILIRGECYSVLRLHRVFGLEANAKDFAEGILIMVESDTESFCLFADELIGEQQVVVKPLPSFIKRMIGDKKRGIAGCTVLGDGSISLILDINNIYQTA